MPLPRSTCSTTTQTALNAARPRAQSVSWTMTMMSQTLVDFWHRHPRWTTHLARWRHQWTAWRWSHTVDRCNCKVIGTSCSKCQAPLASMDRPDRITAHIIPPRPNTPTFPPRPRPLGSSTKPSQLAWIIWPKQRSLLRAPRPRSPLRAAMHRCQCSRRQTNFNSGTSDQVFSAQWTSPRLLARLSPKWLCRTRSPSLALPATFKCLTVFLSSREATPTRALFRWETLPSARDLSAIPIRFSNLFTVNPSG